MTANQRREPRTSSEAKMAAALRRVTVVALAGLDGPASGILELPVSVCWSLEDRQFDLADRGQVRRAYKFVIDAARHADHLVPYLNAALLKDVWQDLGLPPRKRAAWETLNPELQCRSQQGRRPEGQGRNSTTPEKGTPDEVHD